jgi:AAA family ATP:ADP antiporter
MNQNKPSFFNRISQQLTLVDAQEWHALLWSFTYFLSLLCSYYIIRPIRDEMGIAGGVEQLQWLFTATFLAVLLTVPLFGWITSRYPRRVFLPAIYYFFIANLLVFFLLFEYLEDQLYIARIFFVWTSVFNLFAVSVFWSFMADLYSDTQAKRLFSLIAAGGTCGALLGPALTALLVSPLGANKLLLISAALLTVCILSVKKLSHWRENSSGKPSPENKEENGLQINVDQKQDNPLGGSVLAGIRLVFQSPYLLGICALMLLFATLATFLYFQQAQIIHDNFTDRDSRTAVFAIIDFATNALTLLLQIFVSARLIKHWGLPNTLALIPLLLALGFGLLALAPTLTIIVAVQVIRRAGNYAIMRPAREMLYVVLDREEKYKAKNFIDTSIYRAGDMISAWCYAGLQSLGLGLAAIALLSIPVSLLWAKLSHSLGKQQLHLSEHQIN